MGELECGAKTYMMWEARKGAHVEKGAHNSLKSKLKRFCKLGGRKSPRGHEGLSE
jgi:hypothetical protein